MSKIDIHQSVEGRQDTYEGMPRKVKIFMIRYMWKSYSVGSK